MYRSTHFTPSDLSEMMTEAGLLAARGDGRMLPKEFNALLHRIIVACCREGLRNSGQAFGNLFAQVDYLCRAHRTDLHLRLGIQAARRDSNKNEPLTVAQGRNDLEAVRRFADIVFGSETAKTTSQSTPTDDPTTRTPRLNDEFSTLPSPTANGRMMRCIVQSFTEKTITVMPADGTEGGTERLVMLDYSAEHLQYLRPLLREGMQLNAGRGIIVVEPDFLLDISRIAACFEEHGHHPLNFLLNMMKPQTSTQPILLGNMAGALLDEAVHTSGEPDFADTLRRNFREKALEYAACKEFSPNIFKTDAQQQARHIREAVGLLFGGEEAFSKEKAILEPSFICEQLGISGRVDLMTSDFRLLVEQKSGKNWNIQIGRTGAHGSFQSEPHYVQLLLYYGVLQRNFNLDFDRLNLRLLYSRYPAAQGLVVVNYLQTLFREAVRVRNEVVAMCLGIARDGFAPMIPLINPDVLNTRHSTSTLYTRYKLPEIQSVSDRLQSLNGLEKAYFSRMMTFVFRELRVSKLGRQDMLSTGAADLWNMPLQEKTDSGNILAGLHGRQTDDVTVVLKGDNDAERANFRRGDMVYLYAYDPTDEPDVRRSILYRGYLTEFGDGGITVHLSNPQHLDSRATYAVEHAASDSNTTAAVRGLYELMTAEASRRDLLLSQREPRRDESIALSRSYHPDYDDIVRRAVQAKDFFLLVGPPGTGKTSMALQYLMREELRHKEASLLLMAYTNRATDEICGMLEAAGTDYLRIGNAYSCDPAYRHHLPEQSAGTGASLAEIKERIRSVRVVVGTTGMMQARAFIFNIKQFTLAVIDEAGQILEPDIVGLLSKPQIERFILIGDHKQLPAVVQQDEKDAHADEPELNGIGLTDCRRSLFERLLRREQSLGRKDFIGTLRKQGRMHPDIAEWPSKMFYAAERLQPVPLPHQQETSAEPRLLFIPSQLNNVPGMTDQASLDEARIVAEQLYHIYMVCGESFDARKTVGVIVPYRNQIAAVRQEIERLGISALLEVSVDTVERYQGSQRDCIIYSLTVQRPYQLDFLTAQTFEEDGQLIDRKLNVALTRARKQLIITGNETLLSRNALFKALIDHIREYNRRR